MTCGTQTRFRPIIILARIQPVTSLGLRRLIRVDFKSHPGCVTLPPTYSIFRKARILGPSLLVSLVSCTKSRHDVQGVPSTMVVYGMKKGIPTVRPARWSYRFTVHLVRAFLRHLSYNSLWCCYITILCPWNVKPYAVVVVVGKTDIRCSTEIVFDHSRKFYGARFVFFSKNSGRSVVLLWPVLPIIKVPNTINWREMF